MVGGAEGVGDAVLTAVTHEHHVHIAQNGAAVRAGLEIVGETAGLLELPRLPAGSLDGPGDDVLEAAERRPARARDLLGAPTVAGLDAAATPGASSRFLAHAAADYRP